MLSSSSSYGFKTHLLTKSQSASSIDNVCCFAFSLGVWNENTNRFPTTPAANDVMTTSCYSWVSQVRALAGWEKHEYVYTHYTPYTLYTIYILRWLIKCGYVCSISACLIWLCYYFVFIFHSFEICARFPCEFPIADPPNGTHLGHRMASDWNRGSLAPGLSAPSCLSVAACQIKAAHRCTDDLFVVGSKMPRSISIYLPCCTSIPPIRGATWVMSTLVTSWRGKGAWQQQQQQQLESGARSASDVIRCMTLRWLIILIAWLASMLYRVYVSVCATKTNGWLMACHRGYSGTWLGAPPRNQ